jgi:hypothetical protein
LAQPIWSPDGEALLLAPKPLSFDPNTGFDEPYPETLVYEIARGELVQITQSPDIIKSEFQWTPNSMSLVSNANREIVLFSRERNDPLQLAEWTASICHLVWSARQERYFYVAGCVGGEDEPYEQIFSVDLNGNTRPETVADLTTLYPDEFHPRVVGIHPSTVSAVVFFTMYAQGPPDYRRILRITEPTIVEAVHENSQNGCCLIGSSLSPDERVMVLMNYNASGESGDIQVVNLVSGQLVAKLPTQFPGCDMQWLNNTRLLFQTYSGQQCRNTYETSAVDVWLLDLNSPEPVNLTATIDGPAWLLTKPMS